tara:strand:- start:12603 stop:13697 length:1095 start_codon:yes stop_codon:yes gene_type:complete
MTTLNVPLVDLKAQYQRIKEHIDPVVAAVLESAWFVGGPEVAAFESEFATYCERDYCVGVNSGTDALGLALSALGIGVGDEVITVSHTFFATAEAILRLGAIPVFVDVDPQTLLMDTTQLESVVTSKTKAVVPVHLYGQMVPMAPVLAFAKRHDLKVVEDACQAHGARQAGARAGSFGDAAAFSFYPGKNLGAYGDGGAVVTADKELADAVRQLSDHGRIDKYRHGQVGDNTRLDALQAAVLRVKLPRLDAWNARRRELAAMYDAALATPAVQIASENESVYHLYVARVRDRDRAFEVLRDAGIGAGVHYPIPLHKQPAIHSNVALPITERVANEIVSLPMYAEMPEEVIARAAELLEPFALAN